ncbi:mCG148090 [Mus musculus]|nr:mCG148090 [Mus musculus]
MLLAGRQFLRVDVVHTKVELDHREAQRPLRSGALSLPGLTRAQGLVARPIVSSRLVLVLGRRAQQRAHLLQQRARAVLGLVRLLLRVLVQLHPRQGQRCLELLADLWPRSVRHRGLS